MMGETADMQDGYIFGTEWFDEFRAVLGLPYGEIRFVKLVFKTDELSRIVVRYTDGRLVKHARRFLPYGVNPIKNALGLSHTAVGITIVSQEGEWLKVFYEFAMDSDSFLDMFRKLSAGPMMSARESERQRP